jgi:hypothetical protein
MPINMATMYAAQPADNFGSRIRTESPFGEGLLRRTTTTPVAHRAPSNSRSAFARALSDQNTLDMRNAFSEQERDFRQKAEEARSRDVQSRRENQLSNYGLGREKEVTLKQQNTRREISRANLDAYMDRARKDYKVNKLSNIVNLLFEGTLLAAPTGAQMFRAWRAGQPGEQADTTGPIMGGLGTLFSGGAPATGQGFLRGGSDLWGPPSILGGLK